MVSVRRRLEEGIGGGCLTPSDGPTFIGDLFPSNVNQLDSR